MVSPAERPPNLEQVLFERLVGARRTKLPDNWCGYVHKGRPYRCFQGHERFDEEAVWASHYEGPKFLTDRNAAHLLDVAIEEQGLLAEYVDAVLPKVFPGYEAISSQDEVYQFWFALISADPDQKAEAAYSLVEKPT